MEFLRDYGVHFTINRMLTFDSVKLRLDRESPMTFLEFNYMLMQAYDFHELWNRYGCSLQLGGTDQWGNIVNGVELCRRKDGAEVFGLTTPLLTTASGKKMGKTGVRRRVAQRRHVQRPMTTGNTGETQKMQTSRLLLVPLHNVLPMDEVRRLSARSKALKSTKRKKCSPPKRPRFFTESDAAESAAATAQQTFEQGGLGRRLADHRNDAIGQLNFQARRSIDQFIAAGLCASKGEARQSHQGWRP